MERRQAVKVEAGMGLQNQAEGQAKGIGQIEDFISTQVTGRGLDKRTEKAYRQDLEHFFRWLDEDPQDKLPAKTGKDWTAKMENYLNYLSKDRGLRFSTITRKYKVLTYFLAYLVKQGVLSEYRSPKLAAEPEGMCKKTQDCGSMSKHEVDALFHGARREYENLNSDFRKKVCLRDLLMLELLFYHGIEVSELLCLRVSDYDRKTGTLFLHGKRGRERNVYVFSRAVREHMEHWLGERDYFEQDNEYHDRMFLSKLGRPLSMKMVINVAEKYRKLAGIEKAVTPKDLKKSMERYGRELVMEQCG